MNLNTSNLINTINNSCLATQFLQKKHWLYFTLFGHMSLRNLTDARKLVVFAMGLLDLNRYGSLTIHMQIVLTGLVHASSMQYRPQRTCLSTAQTSRTRLRKHLRLNRGSSYTQIGPSTTGGSIKRVNHQSLTATSYLYLALCKAPESPHLWEKHIDQILRDIGLTPTIPKPCIYSGLILGKRVLFMW
jgi:hypothetical protein